MSQEPPNSPQPKNKRKSRSRRGSEGTSPKKFSPPPFWQNIVSNLLQSISALLETGAVRLPSVPWIGIIGLIIAIAIWAISQLFSAKPNQVANVTPTPKTSLPNIERELEITPTPVPEVTPTPSIGEIPLPAPETEPIPPSQITPTQSIEEIPLPEPEITPTQSIEEIPLPEPKTEATPIPEITPSPSIEETSLPEPEITPTQSIEETPLPEPEATPIPTPPKKIVLTPEQVLIAAIKNKVAEISDGVASGLIQSIQANFRTSSLTVIIGDQWYNLPTSEQRKLATQMLQRSQELDFSHLEIMDVQKRLVARNPVVGNEIILFTPLSKS